MARQPEYRLIQKICKMFEARRRRGEPLFYYKCHGSALMRKGLPDIHVCYHGRYIGMEVKMPKGRVSKIQAHVLQEMEHAGAVTGVVRSVQEAEDLLARHLGQPDREP